MQRKALVLTLVLAGSAFASACASGEEVCRDRGAVVVCRDVPAGAAIERCHRNWRGELICRAP